MGTFESFAAIPIKNIWAGVTARIVASEHLTMALVEVAPDTVVPEHRHTNEQLGFVLSGSIRFTVDGETRERHPGDTWRILANVLHQAQAGPSGAVVAEIYSPPRADWAALTDEAARNLRWPTG